MTVTCEACGTANRDKAMFCRGCLARLPAFVPTPVDASKPGPTTPIARKGAFRRPHEVSDERRTRSNTVRYALLGAIALLVVGFVWFALGTASRAPASKTPQEMSAAVKPAEPVSERPGSLTQGSLGPGETFIDSGSSKKSEASSSSASESSTVGALPSQSAPIAPADSTVESAPAAPSSETTRRAAASTTRGRPLDPRQGCENLFFAFADRCEANHCHQSAYARHPRCEIVRKQRLLDEGRRNAMPTS